MEFVRELTNHFNRWCVASSVDNFEGLCNLVILEQFKDTLPRRVATYLNERKVTTAAEGAGLADEYVLVHKCWPGEPGREPVGQKGGGRSPASFGVSSGNWFRAASRKGEDVCNYCREAGHWKSDCPMLKDKKQHAGGGHVKPAALAASVSGPVDVGAWQREWGESGMIGAIDESYLPFISDGFVSQVGSDSQVPVKILRDTGAFDSYVLGSVLSFSEKTDTGDKILMRGMGLGVVPVPVHKMNLDCELVQREVTMGVRPALPIEGVDIILGNDLAGSRVWAKCSPPPVVSLSPLGTEHPDESAVRFPQAFPACVVTRAMSSSSRGQMGRLTLFCHVCLRDAPIRYPDRISAPILTN